MGDEGGTKKVLLSGAPDTKRLWYRRFTVTPPLVVETLREVVCCHFRTASLRPTPPLLDRDRSDGVKARGGS